MNVVDSSAWLAYLAGEANAAYFAPAIEETEALMATAAMQEGLVVPLDARLALEAAAVGHEEGLALADAVIYATARLHGAVLWTQDEHFAGRPGVRFRAKR